jgi:hypothetical protein
MPEKGKRADCVIKHDSNASRQKSPGPSNTRALTPPVAIAALSPLLLHAGVDALTLAFRVALDEIEVARLRSVVEAGQPAPFVVGGQEFEVKALGDWKTRFLLTNANAALCVGPDQNDFSVTVDLRALFVRTAPLLDAIAYATHLALQFSATTIAEVRVRRLDLCADATGLAFSRDDEDSFVTRARRKVRFQVPDKVFTKKRDQDGHLTGFVIAPGNPLLVRIYDKTEEQLAVQGHDSEKARTELGVFRTAGWDGTSPVWRVEAQFRGEVLRQLGAGSPDALPGALDSLWHYAVGVPDGEGKAWLRLVERGSSTRAERCRTDSRWIVFQTARFSGSTSVERVQGSRGGVAPAQALGAILSLFGASSNLQSDDSEQTTYELMQRDAARAAEIFAGIPHLLATYGRRRAAARARYWTAAKSLKATP